MTLEKQNCVKEEKSKFDIFMVGFFDKVFGFIMSLSSEFCHFFPNTESLIFRNLIFHKNKRINELYFQFEARHKDIGKNGRNHDYSKYVPILYENLCN